jgi:acylphosphatase
MRSVENESLKRVHVLFSGRVQRVGFRYTVCHIAGQLNVTGAVRNLANGDVELTEEGPQPALSDFLLNIRKSPLREGIIKEYMTREPPTGEFKQFGVSF